MVAGGAYHDAPVPVDGGALTTARQNLRTQYAFVGALERQRESLCVLSALLGVATPKASGDRLKGPTTHTKGNVPLRMRRRALQPVPRRLGGRHAQ